MGGINAIDNARRVRLCALIVDRVGTRTKSLHRYRSQWLNNRRYPAGERRLCRDHARVRNIIWHAKWQWRLYRDHAGKWDIVCQSDR